MREHLDLAGHEVGVDRAFGTRAHAARDGDAELVAQRLGRGERRGAVGIADDLHEAFAVAQVDEDHAAVVAAAMHPARQRDGLAEVAAVDAAAVVSAFHDILRHGVAVERCRSVRGQRGARRARSRRRRRVAARSISGWSAAGSRVRGGRRCATRRAARCGGACARGATTPIEMMYFSASSTVMSSSRTCDAARSRNSRDVGLGVVGT